MLPITIKYHLTEQGQRILLKSKKADKIENILTQTISIHPTHESYDNLVDIVPIKVLFTNGKHETHLEMDCTSKYGVLQVAEENSIRIFMAPCSDLKASIYIEADKPLELGGERLDMLFVSQTLLLIRDVRKQMAIKEQARIISEQEKALANDVGCVVDVRRVEYSNFKELVTQLRDDSYTLNVKFTYKYTEALISKFLKLCGWDSMPPSLYRLASGAYVFVPCYIFKLDMYVRNNFEFDFNKIKIKSDHSFGTDYYGNILTIPVKAEYEKMVEESLEKQRIAKEEELKKEEKLLTKKAFKEDFIKTSASTYLKRLIADKKSYTHLLEREIVTKYYSNAVIFKDYDVDVYKERACPSVKDYKLLNKIQKKYPNNDCKLKWLEIKKDLDENDTDDTLEWSGCVVVMETDYDFNVVFGYPAKHAGEKQIPLTEIELREANSL